MRTVRRHRATRNPGGKRTCNLGMCWGEAPRTGFEPVTLRVACNTSPEFKGLCGHSDECGESYLEASKVSVYTRQLWCFPGVWACARHPAPNETGLFVPVF